MNIDRRQFLTSTAAGLVTASLTERLSAANGPGTLCAVLVETDDATGLAKSVQPVRLGGKLSQSAPIS